MRSESAAFVHSADSYENKIELWIVLASTMAGTLMQALDSTIATWKSSLEANVDTAIDKWFDDARASVVLAGK